MQRSGYSFQTLKKVNFLGRFSKGTLISNITKIRLVGAEFFNADRQTDMPKPIVTFRNFTNASTNVTK